MATPHQRIQTRTITARKQARWAEAESVPARRIAASYGALKGKIFKSPQGYCLQRSGASALPVPITLSGRGSSWGGVDRQRTFCKRLDDKDRAARAVLQQLACSRVGTCNPFHPGRIPPDRPQCCWQNNAVCRLDGRFPKRRAAAPHGLSQPVSSEAVGRLEGGGHAAEQG